MKEFLNASKERDPQALRDYYAENQFTCYNCLHGLETHKSDKPIRCRKKSEFISKLSACQKCDYYIPDTSVDMELRRIMILQASKKLHSKEEKGDKNASADSNKT